MKIMLPEEDRTELERWVKGSPVGAKQRLRARMVLMTADGLSTTVIMATLGVRNPTLNKWRNRYLESGVESLKKGKARPSRIPPLPTDKAQEVLALTLTGKPVAATQWSCRTMAQQAGISRMAVHGIWREHKLKPHQVRGFKVSSDSLFAEKLHPQGINAMSWAFTQPHRRRPSYFPSTKKAKSKHWTGANPAYR